MSRDTYETWLGLNLEQHEPLTPERMAEMFTFSCRYGSGNGWTGTSGVACAMIRELLMEVESRLTFSEAEQANTRCDGAQVNGTVSEGR